MRVTVPVLLLACLVAGAVTLVPAQGEYDTSDCAMCHEDVVAAFQRTGHAIAPGWDAPTGCQACHGPGEAHIDGGGDLDVAAKLVDRFVATGPLLKLEGRLTGDPETDAELARKTLLEAARGRFLVEALVNRELRGAVLQAFERTFAITTAMYLVAAVVSVVAVATVLFTLVGERRRELATIRVVGGS